MKISFNFDTSQRSFHMITEDNLESLLMEELTSLCDKGASLKVKRISQTHPDGKPDSFLVEMRINGKSDIQKI
jgi:hypothetical protein